MRRMRAGAVRVRFRVWMAGVVALAAGGCSDLAAGSPLAHARTSEEAVVREVFRALEAHDTAAVRALLVTREEYETLLWPEMPDRLQMPLDFSWSLKVASRTRGLRDMMEHLGGAPLALESIRWTKDPEVYPSFTLHRGAEVLARRTDRDAAGVVPSFDVFVEYGGAWKLVDLDEW